MSFKFEHPSSYKKTNINVDKKISYPERELDKDDIMKLASDYPDEAIIDISEMLMQFEGWKEDNPGKSYDDFLEDMDLKRKSFSDGGSTESLGDLYDAYEKGIDVMPSESVGDYIRRIRAAEKASS